MMSAGLVARSLKRRFGAVRALDDLSLSIEPGQFLTVFGPNGAGKTSLLRVLAGALRPDAGTLHWQGEPLDPNEPEWRATIGVLSHRSFLYDGLSVRENLRFFGKLYGIDALEQRIETRLSEFGLGPHAEKRVDALSRGLTQRAALARALLHDPQVVLLDEPYTGLDAHAAAELGAVLSELRSGARTVIMVTHDLVQGARLADRIAILGAGKLLLDADEFPRDATALQALYHQSVGAQA